MQHCVNKNVIRNNKVKIFLTQFCINFYYARENAPLSSNMVQYHDTIRMVNFINPTSTIGIVVDLYPLYSASLPVVPLVRYDY
jgi:hypothetical protein